MTVRHRSVLVALAAALLLTPSPAAAKTALRGTLKLAPGKPARAGKARYTGTYFRMILPGATDKYFANPDSRAKDKTYTLLRPGTDGGLRLGGFQEPPATAFAGNGDALAKRITRPEKFAGIAFSISTAATDAQSGAGVPAPTLFRVGSRVGGDVRAWTAEWNSIYFNQGAPKPNNTFPGFTKPVSGTYDRRTGNVEIAWYSAIVGGPFNGFTGYWHLQGKVVPAP